MKKIKEFLKENQSKLAGLAALVATVGLFTIMYDEYISNLLRMFNVVVKVFNFLFVKTALLAKPVLFVCGIVLGYLSKKINGLFKGALQWFIIAFTGFYIFWLFLNYDLYWLGWYKAVQSDASLYNAMTLVTNGALVGISIAGIFLLNDLIVKEPDKTKFNSKSTYLKKQKEYKENKGICLTFLFIVYVVVNLVVLVLMGIKHSSPEAELLRFRQALIQENFEKADEYLENRACFYSRTNKNELSVSCCPECSIKNDTVIKYQTKEIEKKINGIIEVSRINVEVFKKPLVNIRNMTDNGIFQKIIETPEEEILKSSGETLSEDLKNTIDFLYGKTDNITVYIKK